MTDERSTPYIGKRGDRPLSGEELEPRWFRWQWLRRNAAYAEGLNQLYQCEPGDDVLLAFCNAFALEYGEPPHPNDSEGWRKLECNDESWQRLQDDAGRFVQIDGDSVCFDVPGGIITADVCDQIIAQVQAQREKLAPKKGRGSEAGKINWSAQYKALDLHDAGGHVDRGRAAEEHEKQADHRARKIITSEAQHIELQAQQWRNALAQAATQ